MPGIMKKFEMDLFTGFPSICCDIKYIFKYQAFKY